jgi:ribosome maturation protein Sdo1
MSKSLKNSFKGITGCLYGTLVAAFKKEKAQLSPEAQPKSMEQKKSMLIDYIEAMCDSPDTTPKFQVASIKNLIEEFRKGHYVDDN